MEQPMACVIGDLSLVRALGRAGVRVTAVSTDRGSEVLRSRHVRDALIVPSFVSDAAGAIRELVRYGAAQRDKPVLYYQGDHDLLAVSRQRDALLPHYRFVMPEAELVEDMVDKLRFARLAERHALPVPRGIAVEREALLHDARLAGWDIFPCILKPALRTHWFGSHFHTTVVRKNHKAVRIDTRAELDSYLPQIAEHATDFILQEAITGGEERILSYHAYVRPGGQVVAEFTGKKVRTSPRRYGLSTYVEITDDPEVLALGRAVLRKLDFAGVVKLDFKKDALTERLYLLEANPRFNLWHHPGAVAGVNLPWLVYGDLVGEPRPPLGRVRPGVRWMSARQDLHALAEYRTVSEIDVAGWLHEVVTADVTEDLLLSDPLPTLVQALGTLRRAVSRLVARPASAGA